MFAYNTAKHKPFLMQYFKDLGPDFPKILGKTEEKLRIRSDLGKS